MGNTLNTTSNPMSNLSNSIRSAIATALGPVVRRARGVSRDSFEVQYLALLRRVLQEGTRQSNRTGIDAISLHGAFIRFDLAKGFPVLTTKKLAFKSAVGELVGFLRGKTSAADFRALGCKVWDQNANENAAWLANPYRKGPDDLGDAIYGASWRRFPSYKAIATDASKSADQLAAAHTSGYRVVVTAEGDGAESGDVVILKKEVDQLRACLDTVMSNPTDRRMVFHSWNPAELDAVALPPCLWAYNFSVNVEKREISLLCTMRGVDLGLGLPWNLVGAATLLSLVGRLTGYTAKWVSFSFADAHVYVNQLDMLKEQLRRIPHRAPKLVISDRVPDFRVTGKYEPEWLDQVEPSDFSLEGYRHHAPLTAAMAV